MPSGPYNNNNNNNKSVLIVFINSLVNFAVNFAVNFDGPKSDFCVLRNISLSLSSFMKRGKDIFRGKKHKLKRICKTEGKLEWGCFATESLCLRGFFMVSLSFSFQNLLTLLTNERIKAAVFYQPTNPVSWEETTKSWGCGFPLQQFFCVLKPFSLEVWFSSPSSLTSACPQGISY